MYEMRNTNGSWLNMTGMARKRLERPRRYDFQRQIQMMSFMPAFVTRRDDGYCSLLEIVQALGSIKINENSSSLSMLSKGI